MTPDETLHLCRIARGMCPQQAFDEYTPDAWHLLLKDVRAEDAMQGLIELARTSPFVSPAEIRQQVKRIRSKRIAEVGDLIPPAGLSELEQRQWLRDAKRRIGDGETFTPPQLPPANPRRLRELLATAAPTTEETP